MARIKRGTTTRAKHKNILEQAKGYYGRRKNTIRIARQAVEKAGQYAYRDRKAKKRTFRGLWIQRINAAVRMEGLTWKRPSKPAKKAVEAKAKAPVKRAAPRKKTERKAKAKVARAKKRAKIAAKAHEKKQPKKK